MGMIDREKVIKGLEIHTKPNSRCVGCPYPNNGLCGDQLYMDALELLKNEPLPVLNVRKCGIYFGDCPHCGKRVTKKNTSYCPYCGRRVKWDEQRI